jgi:hypothetical protein
MPDAIEHGRWLLRELLPWARAEAKKLIAEGGMLGFELGALGAATSPYATEDNLDALVIYPAPLGGWHADVLFREVPLGVPSAMGSPVANPYKTQSEAAAAGKQLLVFILCMEAKGKAEKKEPVFILHDCVFNLMPDAYEFLRSVDPKLVTGYGSPEKAADRIAETLAKYFPDGFSYDAFKAASPIATSRLMSVLHMAALDGLYVYPMRRDASPSGHTDAEQSRTRH